MTAEGLPPAQVVAEARQWLGTPYRHRASRQGIGCDCLGLVRGLYRTFYGTEPAPVPPYAPEWAEVGSSDRLLEAARAHLVELTPSMFPRAGELVLFRWKPSGLCKHVGVVSAPDRFIHAYENGGTVESALVPAWRRRIAARFVFPDPMTTKVR